MLTRSQNARRMSTFPFQTLIRIRLVIQPDTVELTALELMHFLETLSYLEALDRERVFLVRIAINCPVLDEALAAFVERRESLHQKHLKQFERTKRRLRICKGVMGGASVTKMQKSTPMWQHLRQQRPALRASAAACSTEAMSC